MTDQKDIITRREFLIFLSSLVINVFYHVKNEVVIFGIDFEYYLYWHIIPFIIFYSLFIKLTYRRYLLQKTEIISGRVSKKIKDFTKGYFLLYVVFTICTINATLKTISTEVAKYCALDNSKELKEVKYVGLYHRKRKYKLKVKFNNKVEDIEIEKGVYENLILKTNNSFQTIEVELKHSYSSYFILASWRFKS